MHVMQLTFLLFDAGAERDNFSLLLPLVIQKSQVFGGNLGAPNSEHVEWLQAGKTILQDALLVGAVFEILDPLAVVSREEAPEGKGVRVCHKLFHQQLLGCFARIQRWLQIGQVESCEGCFVVGKPGSFNLFKEKVPQTMALHDLWEEVISKAVSCN